MKKPSLAQMKIIINAELQDIPQKVTPIKGYQDFWVNCLAALGYNAPYTPVADLLRRYHGAAEGRWLVMTPVHGKVTHNDAMLVQAGESFHFTAAQSKIWFEEIKQFLAPDHFTLIYHDPAHWLVKLPDDDSIALPHSPNVGHILHQSLMPYLAQLDATQYWQRLLTELQMFMSAHPLNSAHNITTGGTLSCNGVWFWGCGALEDNNLEQTPHFLTDDSVLVTLFPQGQLWQQETDLRCQENLLILSKGNTLPSPRGVCDWYWNNRAYRKTPQSWLQWLYSLIC